MSDDTSVSPGAEGGSAGQSAALDDTDRRVVGALVADARLSMRALAQRLHLSRAATYARVQRLVDRGVITGYSARVDPHLAGLGTSAYIALNVEQNSWRQVSAGLVELDYVDTIALLGAEFDVLVQVHAPDNQALRSLVLERIQAIPGVVGTRTWLAFEEIRGQGTPWPQ